MKLLFFTYDFPYPLNSGGKNRAYNFIKYGSKDVEIHLFSFIREKPSAKNIEELTKIGVKHIELFDRPFANINELLSSPLSHLQQLPKIIKLMNPVTSITQKLYFQGLVEEKLTNYIKEEKIDVVHFESFYTAYYISDKIKELGVKQIFGTENIEHKVYREYIKHSVQNILKPFYLLEYEKIKRDELNLLRKADRIIAVTNSESKYFKEYSQEDIEVISNGVDLSEFSFHIRERAPKTLLFVGNFTYFPNKEAIQDFYKLIFSSLQDSDLKLRIIGKKSKELPFANEKNIETVEFVENIVEEYHKGDIFVFPLRMGGGTNFKILEAMACGIPVVAFKDRVEDLRLTHEKEALIANNASEFKNYIQLLEKDNNIRKTLAMNARTFIEENYSWKTIGKKLNSYWKGLYEEKNWFR